MIYSLFSGVLFKMLMCHFNYRDSDSWMLDENNVCNHRTLLCYYLVESSSTSEDNVRIVHLNSSLSKPHQIGPNPYGSASDL